jgi:hypothetical protein
MNLYRPLKVLSCTRQQANDHLSFMSYSGVPLNVHVGSAATDFPMEEIRLVHFHNFKSLPTTKGEVVESPEFDCIGHKWKLQLYPGGCLKTDDGIMWESDDGYIGVYLICLMPEGKGILADVLFTIKRNSGYNCSNDLINGWAQYDDFMLIEGGHRYGSEDYVKRDEVMAIGSELLRQGTLTFEVCMKLHPDSYCHREPQESSLSAAHRTVLRAHAKELAELCESFGLSNPMRIDDVKPDVFRIMIGFVYGEVIPAEIWKEQVQYITDPTKQNQSILFAAGKYGFSALKSKAEVWCVKFVKLDAQNVINHLLYADANSLSQLKEAAMNCITENSKDVIASESFALLSESTVLMTEVMKALSNALESKKRKRDE